MTNKIKLFHREGTDKNHADIVNDLNREPLKQKGML